MTENEKELLIRGFLKFVKSIGSQANNLQLLKRTLAHSLQTTPNYIIAFQEIDHQKKGIITYENMQHYCVQNRIKLNPKSLVFYIGRYGYRDYLDFDEFVLALQPFQPFQDRAGRNKKQAVENQEERAVVLRKQGNKASILALFREVINAEIALIQAEYHEMNSLLNQNYTKGCLLWRMLDREHNNTVSYSQFHLKQDIISQEDWKQFIERSWGTNKTLLNRSMFMQLVAKCTDTNKVIKKVNQQLAKQAKLKQTQGQKLAKKNQEIADYAANKVSIVTQTFSSGINYTESKDIKKRNSKTVLKGKPGYGTVDNPIKSIMIV